MPADRFSFAAGASLGLMTAAIVPIRTGQFSIPAALLGVTAAFAVSAANLIRPTPCKPCATSALMGGIAGLVINGVVAYETVQTLPAPPAIERSLR